MRMFGTVRKDLNRAMTARTNPLPRTAPDERVPVNALIIILVEKGLVGYILERGVNTGRRIVLRFAPVLSRIFS